VSEKKVKLDDSETVKSVGRALAWLKKRDKKLYEVLLAKSKEEGMKASDLLYEALRWKYIDSEVALDQISARDFLHLMERWNDLQASFMKNWLDMLRLFWIEGITKWNEVISSVAEVTKEEEKEEKKAKPSPEFVLSLISSMPQVIMTFLTNIPQMMTAFRELMTTATMTQATTTTTPTT